MEQSPRLDENGNVAKDVDVNPYHTARMEELRREDEARRAEEGRPWSRERVAKVVGDYRAANPTESPVRPQAGISIGPSANLSGADLSGLDLSGLSLAGVNLHGARLTKARLRGANLRGANLHGAACDGVDFTGADLSGANLHGACLCGSDFRESTVKEANLYGVCYEGAKGLPFRVVPLTPADLKAAQYARECQEPVRIFVDKGIAVYTDPRAEGTNLTDVSPVHKKNS